MRLLSIAAALSVTALLFAGAGAFAIWLMHSGALMRALAGPGVALYVAEFVPFLGAGIALVLALRAKPPAEAEPVRLRRGAFRRG